MAEEMKRLEGELKATWPAVPNLPVLAANQFSITAIGPDASQFVLTVGHLAPPVLSGTHEQQLEAIENIGDDVPVLVLARYQIPAAVIADLARILRGAEEIGARAPEAVQS